MRILERYILKSVISLFLSCLFTFLCLYVVIDVFSHLEDILKQKTPLLLLGQYYLAYLPIIFIQVAPFACLLAVLYTFGKLNRDNEIIAMRSSGLSILQVNKSVIIFGLMLSLFIFWVNDRFVPASLAFTQNIKSRIEEGNTKPQEKNAETIENLSIYGLKNRLFFINKFIVDTNTIEGITILEHDEKQNMVKKIVASRGVYKDGLWRFYNSITYDFDRNGQIKQEPQYMEEEIMPIPESPQDFLSQRQRPEFMTIAQLDDYIWKLSKSGAVTVTRNLKVDLYQRFTGPFMSLFIILLGIPFSLMMRRRATGLSSVGFSIIVGFLYYVLNAVSLALGKAGILTPILAASLSHMVALLFSLYLIETLP